MKKPTLRQLLQWNLTGLRRLDCVKMYGGSTIYINSEGYYINAKPVNPPQLITINALPHLEADLSFDDRHSDSERCKRPYYVHGHNLTLLEMKVILGNDYREGSMREHKTSIEDVNSMWKALLERPLLYANAYALGQRTSRTETREFILAVQYFRIDPRSHKALSISSDRLRELKIEIGKQG